MSAFSQGEPAGSAVLSTKSGGASQAVVETNTSPEGVSIYFHDVTESVRAREHLERLNAHLGRERQWLESLLERLWSILQEYKSDQPAAPAPTARTPIHARPFNLSPDPIPTTPPDA